MHSGSTQSSTSPSLRELAFELFKISLFVIGGGYAIITVADRLAARRGWIKEGELLDQLPIFQTIPGIIAAHTAVYLGRRFHRLRGAICCLAAIATPSVVIFSAVAVSLNRLPIDHPLVGAGFVGLRAALAGIVTATVIRSWLRLEKSAFSLAVLLLSVLALGPARAPIAPTLLLAMLAGLAAEWMRPREGRLTANATWLPLLLFAEYGALCLGGGFVIVPMYLRDFVGDSAPYLQLAADEFSNVIALSQMTPGPIGINGATFMGYRLAGFPGAVLASALLLLPGAVAAYAAFSSIDRFRRSRIVQGILAGARPAAISLMLVALKSFVEISILTEAGRINPTGAALTALTTALALRKTANPMLLIVASGILAVIASLLLP